MSARVEGGLMQSCYVREADAVPLWPAVLAVEVLVQNAVIETRRRSAFGS